MREQPISIEPSANLSKALKRMMDNRIGCLVVVDDGRLVGILSERDFLGLTSELLAEGSTTEREE